MCTSSMTTEAFIPNFFNTVTNLIKMIVVDSYFGFSHNINYCICDHNVDFSQNPNYNL